MHGVHYIASSVEHGFTQVLLSKLSDRLRNICTVVVYKGPHPYRETSRVSYPKSHTNLMSIDRVLLHHNWAGDHDTAEGSRPR